MNEVLNKFQLNGGSIAKPQQESQNGPRRQKETAKSLNKSGQVGLPKNQNNLLSSVGL